jgi:misacylated tRNA(Ala) deacylase
MTKALYMLDCYLKEFEAIIKSVKDGKFVVLDQTAFYPNSGGQPYDAGVISKDNEAYKVVYVGKFSGEISHEVDREGLKEGDKVKCRIDWERLYKFMRSHTAAHILAGILEKDAGAKITGNQLELDKSRLDFNLENFDREKFNQYVAKANETISKNLKVNLSLASREEAEQRLSRLTNLAKGFPPEIKEVRLVEIEQFTTEACGGTHVKNTGEIKGIYILKLDNKGKDNRRVYFKLVD